MNTMIKTLVLGSLLTVGGLANAAGMIGPAYGPPIKQATAVRDIKTALNTQKGQMSWQVKLAPATGSGVVRTWTATPAVAKGSHIAYPTTSGTINMEKIAPSKGADRVTISAKTF